MGDLKILTVCNEVYVNIMVCLIQTLEKYHPELPVEMVALNLSQNSKNKFSNMHSNLSFVDDYYSDFLNFEEERAYCESCRTWNIKRILKESEFNVFYIDGDVYLEDHIDELLEFFKTVDFCARMKSENPKYRFNAGMIYVKNTEKNIRVIEEWEKSTLSHGWVWLSAQNELGNTLQKFRNDVVVKTFPKKFNGIYTNKDSVIVHMKGPEKKKRIS